MRCFIAAALPFLLLLALNGQARVAALSDAEVEKLRESAPLYPERVQLFAEFLDSRTADILALSSGHRHAGRELDLHDRMEQFTSIADDLEDNLEDYRTHHRDIRKVLPKLLSGTERWQSALKTPPDNEAYNVARKLALQAVADLHEDADRLMEDQKAWFLAHPPEKSRTPGAGRN